MKKIIISAAKDGHVNQCLAVASRLDWQVEEMIRIPSAGRMMSFSERKKFTVHGALASLRARPFRRAAHKVGIIASGAAAEKIVAWYRRLYGEDLYALFSGRPTWSAPIFDVALVPRHAYTSEERDTPLNCDGARETILRRGVPVRTVTHRPDGKSGTLMMIGGLNKAYDVDPERIIEQVKRLIALEGQRPIAMAFSRRTAASCEMRLKLGLGSEKVQFIDRADREGFEQALSRAADYVVTPDSLTMVCEACDTGRPVRVFDLHCFDPSSTTANCIRDLLEGGEIALAPHGVPKPVEPGGFQVSRAIVDQFRDWLGEKPSDWSAAAAK